MLNVYKAQIYHFISVYTLKANFSFRDKSCYLVSLEHNMRDSKTYAALSSLDSYKLNRFIKFLKSPYFNQNEVILLLGELLVQDIKNQNGTSLLEKQVLWHKLGQKGKYNDARIRSWQAGLLNLFEEFLAQEFFNERKALKSYYLLESIHKSKIASLYNSSIKLARVNSARALLKDSNYYLNEYLTEFKIHEIQQKELKRFEKWNMEYISDSLDKFFIIEKLKVFSKALSHQSFINESYKIRFIDTIENFITNEELENNPIISLYYYNLKLLTQKDIEEYFFKYKILLLKHFNDLYLKEGFELLFDAINYCIRKLNSGDNKYLEEVFELYKFAIDNEILIRSGEFVHWDYKNIISIGLRLMKFNWVSHFIEDYKDKIDTLHRNNAYYYNLSNLFFYRKEYNKVLNTLQKVNYDDLTYSLDARTLQVATFFELDELDALTSALDSFQAFIKRKNFLSEATQRPYINFIKYTKKIISSYDNSNLLKLKQVLINTSGIVNKQWLLQKIEEKIITK